MLAGVNFVLHAAGWLEGGLAVGYEKFILDADQCGMMAVFVKGVDMSENGQALDAILTNEPGTHYLGSAHTLANFESAFYRSDVADNNSFEQWPEDGSLDAAQRANAIWKRMLARVRGAADRPGDRRGAARVHRPTQGLDAGLRRSSGRARSGADAALDGGRATALAGVLAAPKFELVPLKNALDQADVPAAGAIVSVTASPAKGIEATVALCERLQARGFRAVPHLSARMIRDRGHLAELLAWLEGAGVDRAFVVGGDAEEPGEYPDGLSLLRAMAEIGHRCARSGSRPTRRATRSSPTAPLLAALPRRRRSSSYMTTQMCFDAAAIGVVAGARRAEGIDLPVHVGIPGVAEPQRLLSIAPGSGSPTPTGSCQEHALRRPDDPLRRVLQARRAARRPGAADRRPRDRDRRPPPVHVQRGRATERWRSATSSGCESRPLRNDLTRGARHLPSGAPSGTM